MSPMNPMCILKSLTTNIEDKFNKFIDNEPVRWVILFISVILTYVYLLYNTFTYKNTSTDVSEERETALMFNPSLGGYNEIRGDVNSKSLFKWDASECALLSIAILCSIFLYWVIVIKQNNDIPKYIKIIQFLIIWVHIMGLIMIIPVNRFHKRILYNCRSLMTQVCNNSLKELWLAFLFIVVLPLPGSVSYNQRISWFALKLGIFYIIQNFLLGSPNYKIEDSSKDESIPETKSQIAGYAILFSVISLIVIKNYFNCKQ
jgi:hypothetical protein